VRRGVKHDRTIFHALVGRYDFDKKRVGTRYAEHMFLHSMGSVGHIVDSSASGVRNDDALFFIPGCARCCFHKKRVGTRYAKLVFLHSLESASHVVHSGASEARNIDALFVMLRWPSVVSMKSK
jgi:hypothetical protein